ncbi:hypothetical protein [Pseudoroseomonas cervicalis]|uniref:hypothetical protein n=1 Tax=Teichococcus cervicalis TaxID=204525 RepID=UPI0027810A43|nr:hypothetical protein [Pseudoroseomonas cervicalis]MDQ1079916.1 SAM-dependent methyltransferase [Pseudoroseomonas cervicalis]
MPDATNFCPTLPDLSLSDVGALNRALDALVELAWEPGWAPQALARLVALCDELRAAHDAAGWQQALATLRAHPLQRLMLEEPLVREGLARPGPGPGPATLDLLLEHASVQPVLAQLSRAGRDLAAALRQLGYPAALRAQTRFLARIVDAVAERRPQAEILTLGAGHLREAELVTQGRAITRWVMQDSDGDALTRARREAPPGLPLRALRCGLPYFIRRPYLRGCFDLITLAELPGCERNAVQLVDAAFAALKPGGSLLLGSAAAPPAEAAWLEAYLGWRPCWRMPEEMERLAAVPPASELAAARVFPSLDGHRLYLRLERR